MLRTFDEQILDKRSIYSGSRRASMMRRDFGGGEEEQEQPDPSRSSSLDRRP